MILAIDANGLVRTLFHIKEHDQDLPENDDDAIVDDTLDRFQIRLEHLRGWVNELAVQFAFESVRLICAFDSRAQCYRNKIVKEYKAGRTHNPLAYVTIEAAYKMLKESDDWQRMMSPDGFEADDLLASIAANANEPVIIHSADKDMNQCLVDGRVGIIKRSGAQEHITMNGIPFSTLEVKQYTARDFVREFGFEPSRWVDYQCLVGDQADNVKGAVGIGPKKAKQMCQSNIDWRDPAVPDEFGFNSRQRKNWPEFLERWSDLRDVFTLRTHLWKDDQ